MPTKAHSSDAGNGPPFGRIPYAAVARGLVARMRETDAKVYLVLAAHVNGQTWDARPGIATLSKLAGMSERTVQRAITSLTDLGVIQVERGGGRANPNTYVLVTNPVTACQGIEAPKPRHPNVVVSTGNPVNGRANPRQSEPETPSPRVTRTEGTEEQKQQEASGPGPAPRPPSAAAAGGDGAESGLTGTGTELEIIDALTALGIGRPKRDDLAKALVASSFTPERVREIGEGLQANGKGPGVIIRELEAKIQAAAQRTVDGNRRRIDAQHKERAESRDRAALEAQLCTERERTKSRMMLLTDEEIEDARSQVLNQANHFLRPKLEMDKPRTGTMLDLEILKLLDGKARKPKAVGAA